MTAQAEEFWIGEGDEVFGAVRVIEARHEDTFVGLARTYNVGFEELKQANPGVDAWLPGEGTRITIPTLYVLPRAPHQGIVVNVAELRLYYFPADSKAPPAGVPAGAQRVITHPISIGRLDWSTPLGVTKITGKVANRANRGVIIPDGRRDPAARQLLAAPSQGDGLDLRAAEVDANPGQGPLHLCGIFLEMSAPHFLQGPF